LGKDFLDPTSGGQGAMSSVIQTGLLIDMKTFLFILQFMTRLPVPAAIEFTRERLVRGMVFLPIVGMIVGGLAAGVYVLASSIVPPGAAVFLSLSAWVLLTGGLHLDGLADTCDGVFSYRPREPILTIMKDPRIGTNGVLAVVLVLAAKFTALVSLDGRSLVAALVAAAAAGRLALVLAAALGNYAREEEGLGSFVNRTGWRQFVPALVLTLPVLFFDPFAMAIAAGSAMAVPLGMHVYLKRKLGGVTGDTLGACVEMGETWALWALLILENISS